MDRIESCYEMVSSLYAYHWFHRPKDVLTSHYIEDYVDELGEEIVVQIAEQVVESVDYIEHDVFTDSEDCSYNSVKYKNGSSWKIDFN